MFEHIPQHFNAWIAAAASSGVVAWLGFKLLGWVLPPMIVVQMEKVLLRLRSSSWLNNGAHPQRMVAYKAILVMLEAEIPEPGSDRAFYDRLGSELAKHLKGSAKSWSDALQAIGNKMDPELDKEISRLGNLQK